MKTALLPRLKTWVSEPNDFMTHSQINHAKAWGFSRRTPNLNQSALPNALRGVPLNEQPRRRYYTSQRVGDVKWLDTSISTSIQSSTSLMSRLLLFAGVFTASTIATITSSGFRSFGRNYLSGRWQKC